MRTIVHIDMDAFFCAAELTVHPEYAGLPLIVGGPKNAVRSVVSTCSYEARRFGVRSAMPIAQAARLCPQGIFIPPNMQLYVKISRQIHAIFQESSPLVEPVSIDEAFLDMTGCEHFYPDLASMGRSLQERIFNETGCTASVGIAPCKFLAKLASDMRKPRGLVIISPEQVDEVLLPLPVTKIWGVGEKTAAILQNAGIHTVADLRQKSVTWLTDRLGKHGSILYQLARGIDNRAVEPPIPNKSIGHETTFHTDLPPGHQLEQELNDIARIVAVRLQRDGRYGRTIVLKVRFADFTTITRRHTLPEVVRMGSDIARTAIAQLKALTITQPVRLLGIYICDLTDHQQLGLFTDPRDGIVDQLLRKLNNDPARPRIVTAADLSPATKN